MTAMIEALNAVGKLEDLYPIFNANLYTSGWHKARPSLWKQPKSEFQPLHWSYTESRRALDRAGEWIGTELAERRNLLMFNPVGDNDYATVRTLVTAYQMVKPGEYARAHRHSPNALRLVLDAGSGLFTVVDGIKLPMVPGDVLLTPGNCWHSHYNEGEANAYWIDFLDVPLVHLLEPMFYEEYPGGFQPVDEEPESHPFWFPFSESREKIAAMSADENGIRSYDLPSQSHIATVGLKYFHLPKGATKPAIRDTANRIFAVAEGAGSLKAGSLSTSWKRGDIFAIPTWNSFELVAEEETYLLEVSDAPVQKALGFLRDRETLPLKISAE